MTTAALDPLLLSCRRVFLKNYEVWINIGVHEFEKRAEQRVVINVDLYVPLAVSTPRADELDEVVDYDFIRRTVAAPGPGPHPPAGDAVRRPADPDARASEGSGRARLQRQARRLPRLRGGRRGGLPQQMRLARRGDGRHHAGSSSQPATGDIQPCTILSNTPPASPPRAAADS
jgi:hypothetical protein